MNLLPRKKDIVGTNRTSTPTVSRVEMLKRNIARHGLPVALADTALTLVNRFSYEKVLKGVMIDAVNPAYLDAETRYDGSFLTAGALRQLATDPESQVSHAFLDRALTRGDECYAFFDGPELASYGWYSNLPTEIDAAGLALHFDPSYMYMYKGYTHPSHRGQRLHAIGMTRALQSYLARGFRGLVSYVEWNNFDSLKSCYRMGYKDFGNLYVTRVFGRYYSYSDAGCRTYQFRLERVPADVNGRSSRPSNHGSAPA